MVILRNNDIIQSIHLLWNQWQMDSIGIHWHIHQTWKGGWNNKVFGTFRNKLVNKYSTRQTFRKINLFISNCATVYHTTFIVSIHKCKFVVYMLYSVDLILNLFWQIQKRTYFLTANKYIINLTQKRRM